MYRQLLPCCNDNDGDDDTKVAAPAVLVDNMPRGPPVRFSLSNCRGVMTPLKVIDGDTIHCAVTLSPQAPLRGTWLWTARIHGIDAPELRRPVTRTERMRALACKYMLEARLGVVDGQPITSSFLVTVTSSGTEPFKSGIDLYGRLLLRVSDTVASVDPGNRLHINDTGAHLPLNRYMVTHSPCRVYDGRAKREPWSHEELTRADKDPLFVPFLQRAEQIMAGYYDDMNGTSSDDDGDSPVSLKVRLSP
jgi:hypothetical protein